MENGHNIRLSRADSKQFYYDMTHIDRENQNRINCFMDDIERNVSVRSEGEKIIGHSEELDIADILRTLQGEDTDCNCKKNISSSVTICYQKSTTDNFSECTNTQIRSASVSIKEQTVWSRININAIKDLPCIA